MEKGGKGQSRQAVSLLSGNGHATMPESVNASRWSDQWSHVTHQQKCKNGHIEGKRAPGTLGEG